MWIKRLPADYYEQSSSFSNSLMLWRKENVYVMDNHLSAAWCWLQSCNPKKEYNFMHIDTHYDMLDCFHDEDLKPLRDNTLMSYEGFESLKRSKEPGKGIAVFRNDNYIMALYTIYPNWFHTNMFLTQRKGSLLFNWGHTPPKIHNWEVCDIASYISKYICSPNNNLTEFEDKDYKLPWIVNLDIDFFFEKNEPHSLRFSDEQIRHFAQVLNRGMQNIQVLTIALSPDCINCKNIKKGWDDAFYVLKILSEEIPSLSEFPFPEV